MSRYFTDEHEWIELEGDTATVGITDYAQEQLGDITYVELPEVGDDVAKSDACCVVESVKAASDVYAPVSGEVTEINEDLEEEPETVNNDAEGDGWLFKVKLADKGELEGLMDEDGYKTFLENL